MKVIPMYHPVHLCTRHSAFNLTFRRFRLYTMAHSEIPRTMSGIQIEKTGGVEVLQYKTDLPVPSPKVGEVLVKNEVAGVNFIGS